MVRTQQLLAQGEMLLDHRRPQGHRSDCDLCSQRVIGVADRKPKAFLMVSIARRFTCREGPGTR